MFILVFIYILFIAMILAIPVTIIFAAKIYFESKKKA